MIKKSTIKKVGMLEDFAFWIAEEILDSERTAQKIADMEGEI